jgi:cellulose synthase/poly-beta-1,6-N-acetylglucosamine synthase-like glycosyltransferase
MDVSIVGVVPCYNEELTIGKVITDFKKVVPEAKIYVFDNNSTDKTAEIANPQAQLCPLTAMGRGLICRWGNSGTCVLPVLKVVIVRKVPPMTNTNPLNHYA